MCKSIATATYIYNSKIKSIETEILFSHSLQEVEDELAEKILTSEFPDDFTYFIIESSPRGSKPPQRKTITEYLKQKGITIFPHRIQVIPKQ